MELDIVVSSVDKTPVVSELDSELVQYVHTDATAEHEVEVAIFAAEFLEEVLRVYRGASGGAECCSLSIGPAKANILTTLMSMPQSSFRGTLI